MSRPKSKEELLLLSTKNYQKLLDLINTYDKESQLKSFPEGTLNRNIRDVLTHLHHWHLMMMNWYLVGMSGAKPEMPAKGYTWKTTPILNKKIWECYQKVNLKDAKGMLEKSFYTIQKIINNHTNEELFTKKKYKWTGTTSLGSYLVSATSSHYEWAFKLIKKAKKKIN